MGEFFFSQIQGIPIYDHEGRQVGELRDLAIRWERETPKVTGIKYAKGVQRLIPVEQVDHFNPDRSEAHADAGGSRPWCLCSPMKSTWANG